MMLLLEIVASNVLMASLIAVVAALVSRWGRRPALAHALWLLVFFKLITPPLLPLHLGGLLPAAHQPHASVNKAANEAPRPNGPRPETNLWDPQIAIEELAPPSPEGVPVENHDWAPEHADARAADGAPMVETPSEPPATQATSVAAERAIPWSTLFLLIWLSGSIGWLCVATYRLERFYRMLRFAHRAPPSLQRHAEELSKRLGTSCPAVWLIPGQVAPMLWVYRSHPRLLLPESLLQRLTNEQLTPLLLHELAHWKRRDHWVRRLEMIVLALYWWCPLVWWARAELEQAEEECCDAWVVWALPGAARSYALVLVETVDFLSGARAAMPPIASGMGQVRHLRRRLTMIMTGKNQRALTWSGALFVVAAGAVLLPWMPSWAQTPGERNANSSTAPNVLTAQNVGDEPQQPGQDFQKHQKELERAQKELRALQAELDQKRRELEQKARFFEEAARRLAEAQHSRVLAEGAKVPNQREDITPPPVAGGRGGQGSPGGMSGRGGPDRVGGDVNRRLDALEHKLDEVLRELRQLRQGAKGAAIPPGVPYGAVPAIPTSPVPPAATVPPPPGVPRVTPPTSAAPAQPPTDVPLDARPKADSK